jgi:hypothetical protein
MNSNPVSDSRTRIVRILLLLIGATMIAYAISDHPFYGGERGFGGFQALIAFAGGGIAICSFLPAAIRARILVLAVTSLLMLAIAEIAGESLLGPRLRPIYQYDDRLIFKFIPNRRSAMTRAPLNGGVTVTHRINSAGFRGNELQPAGEGIRIAVYGDSFIHAFYTAEEETFVAQLGAMLSRRLGKQVETVNAGVSSYGPDQESLKMEDELPGLRPSLVIMAIFAGNDYGDLMRNKMFLLGADGGLVTNRWKLDRKLRMLFALGQQESILKRGVRNILQRYKRGNTADLIDMDFLLAESEREYRNFVAERDDVVTNIYTDYYSANVSLTPRSASARYEIALMRAVLRRMRDVTARSGVPLAFLFIPHPFDVTDQYDDWRVDRKRYPEYDGRNQIAPLEDAARALGVPFVSLYDVFRANHPNALYFHGGDDHWNAAGQRLAAQLVTDYLLAHGMLNSAR